MWDWRTPNVFPGFNFYLFIYILRSGICFILIISHNYKLMFEKKNNIKISLLIFIILILILNLIVLMLILTIYLKIFYYSNELKNPY